MRLAGGLEEQVSKYHYTSHPQVQHNGSDAENCHTLHKHLTSLNLCKMWFKGTGYNNRAIELLTFQSESKPLQISQICAYSLKIKS